MKLSRILFCSLFLLCATGAFAQTSQVKDDSGKVLFSLSDFAITPFDHVDQVDAAAYCVEHNSRLPTARELALYSHSLGAIGITAKQSDGNCDRDSDLVSTEDDQFCFNYHGYQRPAGDLGTNPVWSSSVVLGDSVDGWFFNGVDGKVDSNRFYGAAAIRCIVVQ